MKDYNNELEKILENKSFSIEVKNILQNILYKINTAYLDYSTVKRNVEDKKTYIENLLNLIENCNEINLMEIKDDNNENIFKKFKVDKQKHKIDVYPNEKVMLYAINNLNYMQMYLNENYKIIKNSFPELINKGIEINNTEIIRDFDAWSWNTQIDEIESLEINLIYQNLLFLLGYEKLNEILTSKSIKTDLETLEKSLELIYDEKAKRYILLMYKISIILCVNNNKEERKRLFSEKKWLEQEFNRLNNKKKLLEDVTNSKKAIMEEIKKIDIILNNKELLFKEYKNRNDKMPEHSKIFSLSHFSEILLRDRKKELEKIEEYNKMLEPKNYTNIKTKFEKDLELLNNIKLDGKLKTPTTKEMIKLQEFFLECFKVQIEKVDTKREVIYLTYCLRYYNFIPFTKEECIKDVKDLKPKLVDVENMLIEKLYSLKVINRNMELNIIDNIFHTKIISLENIQFEFKIENENIVLVLYDEETISETIQIDINDIDTKKIKFNKKMKLFN